LLCRRSGVDLTAPPPLEHALRPEAQFAAKER
jgi:hypothetical protein